jgi:HK97 family phage major capsid protein
VAAICVLSQELIRFSTPSAEAIVRDQLAKTLGDRLDQDFIDPDVAAVANVSPASITRGATVLTPSGTNLAAVNTDIQTIVGKFITANIPLNNLTWIMPNSVALSLSLMLTSLGNRAFPDMGVNGGTLAGIPVVTSQWANSISTSPT